MFAVRLITIDNLDPLAGNRTEDLFWFDGEDRFVYEDGPRTLYETELEAEGAILWIICLKGAPYFENLEVVRAESKTGAL
jgi:hypothetical protein